MKNFNIKGGSVKNLIIGGFTKNQYMGGNCLKEGSFDNLQV